MLAEGRKNTKFDLIWIAENLGSLWQFKSPQQILRKLSDILATNFEFDFFDFVKLEFREGQWHVFRKRFHRHFQIPQIPSHVLMDLKSVIQAEDMESGDITDGIHQIHIQESMYSLSMFRYSDEEMTAFIWKPSSTASKSRGAIELFVKSAQNEVEWLRRIQRSERLLYIDDLTGLYNTRYFDFIVANEIRRAERFKSEFTLLFIDLDGFKPINDQFGHLAGSQVLRQVAKLIRDTVREVDIPIRFGGDEFIVMLIGASSEMGAMVAERVRCKVDECLFQIGDNRTAHVTCSIGVASYPKNGRDKNTLTKIADESMYDSKRMGKNRVTVTSKLGEKSCNS